MNLVHAAIIRSLLYQLVACKVSEVSFLKSSFKEKSSQQAKQSSFWTSRKLSICRLTGQHTNKKISQSTQKISLKLLNNFEALDFLYRTESLYMLKKNVLLVWDVSIHWTKLLSPKQYYIHLKRKSTMLWSIWFRIQWTSVLDGLEYWTLTRRDRERLLAFETKSCEGSVGLWKKMGYGEFIRMVINMNSWNNQI